MTAISLHAILQLLGYCNIAGFLSGHGHMHALHVLMTCITGKALA